MLLHLVIVSLVIASPQIAKAGVEEWPRGKAQEGNTVDSYEVMSLGGRLEDNLACNLSLSESASYPGDPVGRINSDGPI